MDNISDFFTRMFTGGSGTGIPANSNSIFAGTPYAGMSLGDISATAPDPTAATTAFNAAGGAGGSSGGIGSTIGNWLMKNPGIALGGALLAGQGIFGNNSVPGLSAVQGVAGQDAALADQALSGLKTGQVPPGAQSVLDSLTSSMKTKVRSQYANLGLSGSTMEAQDLAKVDQEVAGQKWGIINSLVGTGTAALSAEGTLDQASMNAQVQQDQEMQKAIASFAAALAGGGLKAAA